MRGKVLSVKGGEKMEGITPAHAGKSHNIRHSEDEFQDHPRTCGEKLRQHRL